MEKNVIRVGLVKAPEAFTRNQTSRRIWNVVSFSLYATRQSNSNNVNLVVPLLLLLVAFSTRGFTIRPTISKTTQFVGGFIV